MSERIQCSVCDGEGWVCENHADRPWNKSERGCECGAGMPCDACNTQSPPRMQPGSTIIFSVYSNGETVQ